MPTIEELGLKGYEVGSWQAIVTTAGTPQPVVERLYQETTKALKMPDVVDRLATQGGNELVGNTPAEFAAVIASELARYGGIMRKAGIAAE